MTLETEGIIFRQTRMVQGRRMLLLFTRKYGKISVGSNVGDRGRSRTALALKPFTFGNYQIYEGRNYYELDRADAVTSYYGIGEDLDRYAAASYALELTEKVLPEGLPQPKVFDLVVSFLSELEQRKRRHETLLLAFEVKLLDVLGVFPELDTCVSCGKTSTAYSAFSVSDGGVLCDDCAIKYGWRAGEETPGAADEMQGAEKMPGAAGEMQGAEKTPGAAGEASGGPAGAEGKMMQGAAGGASGGPAGAEGKMTPGAAKEGVCDGPVISGESAVNFRPNSEQALIFPINTDIINVVKYYARNPMQKFAGLALSDDVAARLRRLLKAYIDYHFDIGELKSEGLFYTDLKRR